MVLGIVSARKEKASTFWERIFLSDLDAFLEGHFQEWISLPEITYALKYSRGNRLSVNGQNTWANYHHSKLGKVHHISKLVKGGHLAQFLLETKDILDCQKVSNALASFNLERGYEIERRGLIMPFDFNRIAFRELSGRDPRILSY